MLSNIQIQDSYQLAREGTMIIAMYKISLITCSPLLKFWISILQFQPLASILLTNLPHNLIGVIVYPKDPKSFNGNVRQEKEGPTVFFHCLSR